MYFDKPLKAHGLMQAIARANRVSKGKSNGLIIDYIGVVKALRKALADYTENPGGAAPPTPWSTRTSYLRGFPSSRTAPLLLCRHWVTSLNPC